MKDLKPELLDFTKWLKDNEPRLDYVDVNWLVDKYIKSNTQNKCFVNNPNKCSCKQPLRYINQNKCAVCNKPYKLTL